MEALPCGSVLFLNGRCASFGLVRSSYLIGSDPICIVAVESILCETCFFQELVLSVCHGESFAFAFEYTGDGIVLHVLRNAMLQTDSSLGLGLRGLWGFS
jgi:hypothetical protein